MATNGNLNHQGQHLVPESYPAPSSTTESTSAAGASTNNLPKDEVGWYFVEQYYTTLSKSPEKLHLFYGKRSQYVYGREAEVTNVSVGRQAIQERIKALDIQDCKVRISNVDSQGSGENIVIQVIGETSNKAAEPKKFVQTFILAQQPSGYFVLNDIFRFIDEDIDEEQEDAAEAELTGAEQAAAQQTSEPFAEDAEALEEDEEEDEEEEDDEEEEAAEESEPVELDASAIDKKLEEVGPDARGTPDEPPAGVESDATAAKTATPSVALPDPEKTVQDIAEEEVKKPETPKDPTPTPVVPSRAPAASAAPSEPEKPAQPPKPMTWANRAAAAAGTARPAVPAVPTVPKAATPAIPAQPRPTAPAATGTAVAASGSTAPQQAPAQATESAAAAKDANGWQTAETKRQNRPLSISGAPADKEGTMAYIKYVTEKIQTEDLRAALAKFGELAYFDINRQKNCAFVEFATQTGYNAAVAANPHIVNGEQITVEQRRPKANAYGGSNYNASRGGAGGRGGRTGSGGYEPSRSGSQGGSRGGFTSQARGSGRGGAPRGRGASGGTSGGNA
ncbi:hypothetical protein GQ53DRAFT_825621 [Thozetella sp. PMI_491]|nr:hypothetical protein GQ53DRAFT_825621 [Thozetella sp. PMI_491]